MTKKKTYDNDSISSLKGADRVRKRPGVIFGSDGLEGCEHAVFEILSNAIDEARAGFGRVITVTRGECSTDLVKYADYALPVGSTEMILRSGAMSSRISQLNIIDILYTAYINRNYDACVKKFADNYIEKN